MKKQNLFTLLCCCSFVCSHAQYNWLVPGPASHPQFLNNEAMATLGGDKVLEFGNSGETWVYDLSDNTWTSMQPAISPTGVNYHVMANIGGDKVLLFGGLDYITGTLNNETWVYDYSDNAWTLQLPEVSPAIRVNEAMAYAGGDHVVMYGGGEYDLSTETWMYDLSANTWTLMSPTSNPGSEILHAMASLGDDRVLLFDWYQVGNLTWVYDLSNNTWTLMSPAIEPDNRYLSAMASLGDGRVLLFGGRLWFNTSVPDTWLYDYSDNTWTELFPSFFPGTRYGHCMASITPNHVLLFGGNTGDLTTYIFRLGEESINVDAGDCSVVCLGYAPAQCQSLTVTATGGTTPYNYLWSNGSTAQNITVCPSGTTTYTVTVTDQTGNTGIDNVTVHVVDDRCGTNNNKVVICHGGQSLCVAPSAVPAHLGHGDYLGDCNAVNPCYEGAQSMVAIISTENTKDENLMEIQTKTQIEDHQENEIILFPNPADAFVNIRLPGEEKHCEILLFDISGKLLKDELLESGKANFSTADLEDGIYLIQIRHGRERVTTTIVVMH